MSKTIFINFSKFADYFLIPTGDAKKIMPPVTRSCHRCSSTATKTPRSDLRDHAVQQVVASGLNLPGREGITQPDSISRFSRIAVWMDLVVVEYGAGRVSVPEGAEVALR